MVLDVVVCDLASCEVLAPGQSKAKLRWVAYRARALTEVVADCCGWVQRQGRQCRSGPDL